MHCIKIETDDYNINIRIKLNYYYKQKWRNV